LFLGLSGEDLSAMQMALDTGGPVSARKRNRTQYVHENAVLYFKRPRANNEIELGDDANRLPAPAKRAHLYRRRQRWR